MRTNRLAMGLTAAALLAWGLVAAPLAHQLTAHRHQHEEPVFGVPRALSMKAKPSGPTHSHGAPGKPGQQREHGVGSLEHGQASLHASPAVPSLIAFAVAVAVPVTQVPLQPQLAAWHRVEQQQGP